MKNQVAAENVKGYLDKLPAVHSTTDHLITSLNKQK